MFFNTKMMDISQHVPNKIYESFVLRMKSVNDILQKQKKIIAAVSGGPDSMFLLLLLYKYSLKNKIEIIPVYINHHVRSKKEIKKDIDVIQNFCKKVNLKLIVDEIKTNKKDENTLREKRYKKLVSIAKKYDSSVIATAHTLNDVVETFFLNLLRGTGIKGLCGIPFLRLQKEGERNFYIVRPLIDITKNKILTTLNTLGIKYTIDKTNLGTVYKRNFLRNKILPMFKEINVNYEKNIVALQQYFYQLNEFIENISNEAYTKTVKVIKQSVIIDLKKFIMYNNFIRQQILYKLFSELFPKYRLKIKQGIREVVDKVSEFILSNKKQFVLSKKVAVIKGKKWVKINIKSNV